MQLTIIPTNIYPVVEEFGDKMAMLSLTSYASEAGVAMDFDSAEELHESVKRAMELCISAGIPTKGNFQRVYKSSPDGIVNDWKLSLLAYRLVCLSGRSSNPSVAHFTVDLIKNEHINHF